MSGFRVPGEIGGGSKYRSTSTTSLPRSPTGIEQSYLPERKLGTSIRYLSSSVETSRCNFYQCLARCFQIQYQKEYCKKMF